MTGNDENKSDETATEQAPKLPRFDQPMLVEMVEKIVKRPIEEAPPTMIGLRVLAHLRGQLTNSMANPVQVERLGAAIKAMDEPIEGETVGALAVALIAYGLHVNGRDSEAKQQRADNEITRLTTELHSLTGQLSEMHGKLKAQTAKSGQLVAAVHRARAGTGGDEPVDTKPDKSGESKVGAMGGGLKERIRRMLKGRKLTVSDERAAGWSSKDMREIYEWCGALTKLAAGADNIIIPGRPGCLPTISEPEKPEPEPELDPEPEDAAAADPVSHAEMTGVVELAAAGVKATKAHKIDGMAVDPMIAARKYIDGLVGKSEADVDPEEFARAAVMCVDLTMASSASDADKLAALKGLETMARGDVASEAVTEAQAANPAAAALLVADAEAQEAEAFGAAVMTDEAEDGPMLTVGEGPPPPRKSEAEAEPEASGAAVP